MGRRQSQVQRIPGRRVRDMMVSEAHFMVPPWDRGEQFAAPAYPSPNALFCQSRANYDAVFQSPIIVAKRKYIHFRSTLAAEVYAINNKEWTQLRGRLYAY